VTKNKAIHHFGREAPFTMSREMSPASDHRLPRHFRREGPTLGALVLLLAILATGCDTPPDPAETVIHRGIEAHGAKERFDRIRIDFDFRGDGFVLERDRGRFHYERIRFDEEGRRIVEVMDNEGTRFLVDDRPVTIDEETRASIETAVNSVIYFGFLPFRLDDPAVRARDMGTAEFEDRTLETVEVTFEPEGGGVDWEDRFIYWFDAEEGTLEYLAYRFHTGDGGTRFRRAINRRDIDGILIQDYENFTADPEIRDIAEYLDRYRAGELTLVSEVRLENVRISSPDPED
jgi:hypothetical protein